MGVPNQTFFVPYYASESWDQGLARAHVVPCDSRHKTRTDPCAVPTGKRIRGALRQIYDYLCRMFYGTVHQRGWTDVLRAVPITFSKSTEASAELVSCRSVPFLVVTVRHLENPERKTVQKGIENGTVFSTEAPFPPIFSRLYPTKIKDHDDDGTTKSPAAAAKACYAFSFVPTSN